MMTISLFLDMPLEIIQLILGKLNQVDLTVMSWSSKILHRIITSHESLKEFLLDDTIFCMHTASAGYLNLLKWAYQNSCPLDKYTCYSAAGGGHLDVLKYLHENGCPWG